MFNKEIRKALKDYKLELLKQDALRKNLLDHKTDWGLLESFIKQCNDNPGLKITVILNDGTKLELSTTKEQYKPKNPLFTEQAFLE